MPTRISFFIFLTIVSAHVMAQKNVKPISKSISVSQTPDGKFYYGSRNEPPRAIEFNDGTVSSAAFISNVNRYFNIPSEFTFSQTETNTDNLGIQHSFLQQYFKGIPLEGMGYRMHEKNGFVKSANGRAVRTANIDVNATISEQQAFQLGCQYLQTKDTTKRQGKKVITSKGFTFSPESFYVAFQFDIDVSLIERWRISIDARTGQLINKVSLVNNCFGHKQEDPPLPYGTGTGLTNYYGSQTIRVEKFDGGSSRLVGQTENGGNIGTYDFGNVNILSFLWFWEYHRVSDFYSADNTYNNPYQRTAVSVQWGAEQAFEYYFKKHNRNSYDNKGAPIRSYVHVDINMDNAFWSRNTLLFGDGSNNNPLVELDVIGHELTHGVTQYEAGLNFYGEPGALNESFSDILGKAIEFDTFGDSATWRVAKRFREGGLRDFSNPNAKNQPDTWMGDMWYTGYEDYGGVHYNSGVQNFWYYLLCKGGTGVNDKQISYSVNAIGMDAATKIVYRNLTEYLGYLSDYLDSRIGSLLATADLYGKNSSIYQEVDKAWDAVGVVDEPIITSLELYDITATTVKFNGSLLPRGDSVTYRIEYGTTPALGSSSANYKYVDKVAGIVTGLQSNTKYYLRLVAINENGSSYMPAELTTISLAPLAKIKQTVDVTETTAMLLGKINPNSLPTSYHFEYGLTNSLGSTTPPLSLPGSTEYLTVSTSISGLQPRKKYFYRLVATNGFATVTTELATLFTAVKPVISSYSPFIAAPGTEVIIRGENFNPVKEKNIVSFGATRSEILSATANQLKLKVPIGASHGPISIMDADSGLEAKSVQEFVPTYNAVFKKEDLQLRVGINDVYIYQALVQDMDADGKPDIVALHNLGFSIYQNVNNGGDITTDSFIRNTFNSEYGIGFLSLVDFDGNGLQDVVGRYKNGIRIWPNMSAAGFIFFAPPVDLPIDYLQNLIFADFDNDGHVDIAGHINTWAQGSTLRILRNENPQGNLSSENFSQQFEKALPYFIDRMSLADLNNDGAIDIIAGVYNKTSVPVFLNNSQPGNFTLEEISVPDPTRSLYPGYNSFDLNQDGWKDIISNSQAAYPDVNGTVSVLENKKTAPNIGIELPVVILTDNGTNEIKPGDIDGDGKVDLLVGLDNRSFTCLKNNGAPNVRLSGTSFQTLGFYGMSVGNTGSNNVETRLAINDLNGDGRPEVITAYSYYYGPHDGYYMEIWQNAPPKCQDPSMVKVNTSMNSATIVLPNNSTFDQFQIEYLQSGYSNWTQVTTPTFYIYTGVSYKLRVRAKCYLGFTDYAYVDFISDCVDTNSFMVTNILPTSVTLQANNIYQFDVQYSVANANLWMYPQSNTQISGLSPGTTYDLRFRGRCNATTPFNYMQFTTQCPKLTSLTVSGVTANKAIANWTSSYAGNVIIEYSLDNSNWILIGANKEMSPLLPAKQYFVRGRLVCANTNSDFIYTSFVTLCPKVSAIAASDITPFSARVNWVDDSKTGAYIVNYSQVPGGSNTSVQVNSTSVLLSGLNPGTTYTFSIAPQCSLSKDFTTISFTTICFALSNLSISDITQTDAQLSWSNQYGGVPYFVDYSISGSELWKTISTTSTNTALTALRPGIKYEVRVYINCASVKAPYLSQTFETKVYKETTLAPNPTDGRLTLYPSKNLIGKRFSMHDYMGRVIATGQLLDYNFDLSTLSAGFYTLEIEGEGTLRIIKQ